MYYYSNELLLLVFNYFLICVNGERDQFEKKCKRECNTEHGTLNCWKQTTDGFAYGLSTTMIDYCQIILQISQMKNPMWYNISQNILIKQIEEYNLEKNIRQLNKTDIEQISLTLLNQCFSSSSPSSVLSQPACPSCPIKDDKLIKQWTYASLFLSSLSVLLILIMFLIYALNNRHTRRSYQTIN